ncbi:MAG TPA: sarcosine oxidase subunit delta [Bauldia sp.]|nr:sarcosine oxidase subunit delta [Bauldia sp.]
MLLIPCVHCGERDEVEFRYGGEVEPAGNVPSEGATSGSLLKANTAGVVEERWFHLHGCQEWITLRRNTLTDLFGPSGGRDPQS